MKDKIKLSFLDKLTIPFSEEYKNFIQKMKDTPSEQWYMDGERRFTEKEKKFMAYFDWKNEQKNKISAPPNKSNSKIIGSTLQELAGKTLTDKNYQYIFDKGTQYMINSYIEINPDLKKVPLTAEDYLKISGKWLEEMNNPTEMSNNMTVNQIAEKQSNYFSLGNHLQEERMEQIEIVEEKLESKITVNELSNYLNTIKPHDGGLDALVNFVDFELYQKINWDEPSKTNSETIKELVKEINNNSNLTINGLSSKEHLQKYTNENNFIEDVITDHDYNHQEEQVDYAVYVGFINDTLDPDVKQEQLVSYFENLPENFKKQYFSNGVKDTISVIEEVNEEIMSNEGKIGVEELVNENIKIFQNNNQTKIIGGKIKDIANEAIKNPEYLKQFDLNTQNIINQYINSNKQNSQIMDREQTPQKEFNKVEHLKNQMKYLGFGENKELHEQLEKGIAGQDKNFTINTSSDKTLPGNKMDYSLNFSKSEKGGVFLNSFNGMLTTRNGEERTHNFPVNKNMLVTAKEALNLLEGRSVKVEYKPKNAENSADLATAFIKLNLQDEKTEKGQYKVDFYTENYGINTKDIVEKSGFVFDKPEQKDYLIKNLEKGNIAKAKFELNDKTIEGKAILNPQYKNIQFYDSNMNRINTNKPVKNLKSENERDKANVRQHSHNRSL